MGRRRRALFRFSVENHGFARDYTFTNEGRIWALTGEQERAKSTFSEDGRTQEVSWERKRAGSWLPVCDRTAVRMIDRHERLPHKPIPHRSRSSRESRTGTCVEAQFDWPVE